MGFDLLWEKEGSQSLRETGLDSRHRLDLGRAWEHCGQIIRQKHGPTDYHAPQRARSSDTFWSPKLLRVIGSNSWLQYSDQLIPEPASFLGRPGQFVTLLQGRETVAGWVAWWWEQRQTLRQRAACSSCIRKGSWDHHVRKGEEEPARGVGRGKREAEMQPQRRSRATPQNPWDCDGPRSCPEFSVARFNN